MKYIFLVATIAIQFLAVLKLKMLDNISIITGLFMRCIITGFIMRYAKPNIDPTIANIGWGLLYGSFASLALAAVFIIWLSFNFPK